MNQLLKCVLFCCSAIAEFLELDGSEERSQGWMLLSTLNLLAAEGNTLVEVGDNFEGTGIEALCSGALTPNKVY
jgi:hypothetical protein